MGGRGEDCSAAGPSSSSLFFPEDSAPRRAATGIETPAIRDEGDVAQPKSGTTRDRGGAEVAGKRVRGDTSTSTAATVAGIPGPTRTSGKGCHVRDERRSARPEPPKVNRGSRDGRRWQQLEGGGEACSQRARPAALARLPTLPSPARSRRARGYLVPMRALPPSRGVAEIPGWCCSVETNPTKTGSASSPPAAGWPGGPATNSARSSEERHCVRCPRPIGDQDDRTADHSRRRGVLRGSASG